VFERFRNPSALLSSVQGEFFLRTNPPGSSGIKWRPLRSRSGRQPRRKMPGGSPKPHSLFKGFRGQG
jgi:hypothetical protein